MQEQQHHLSVVSVKIRFFADLGYCLCKPKHDTYLKFFKQLTEMGKDGKVFCRDTDAKFLYKIIYIYIYIYTKYNILHILYIKLYVMFLTLFYNGIHGLL